jgi:DNA repair ATPase RecN
MGKLKSYQEQIQEIVENGINAAEEQQKKLAAKPFDYAEKLESGAREYSVKSLRKRYNGYSENLFEQLRSLNSRVGNFAADLVAKLEKEAAESAEAVSDAADDVSEAAQSAKKTVESKKQPARKTAARKSSAKSTASA